MVVIPILFVCVFSSLSQGLSGFSNCSATKCMQCSITNGNEGSSLPIDCDVKNISEYQYEISCENIMNDNCSVVDILPDKFLRHVCFYQLSFFNGIWKLLAANIPTSIGDTCNNIQTRNDPIMISPNCTNFFQRSSISDIYKNPYSCYCYNDNCNILNTITVEITNKDTPVISSSVDTGVYSSIINISPSLVYDTTHVTSSVSSSTTGYINSYVTSSLLSFSSLSIPFSSFLSTSISSSYSLQNSTSSPTQSTTPSYVTMVTSSPSSFSSLSTSFYSSLSTSISSSYSLQNSTSSSTQSTTPSKNTVPISEVGMSSICSDPALSSCNHDSTYIIFVANGCMKETPCICSLGIYSSILIIQSFVH